MSMTAPIADFLTRNRNGIMAAHETVEIPSSRLKREMARILTEQGYIEGYDEAPGVPGSASDKLLVRLKYTENRTSVISGLRRVSRPGRRTYVDSKSIPKVLGGMGTTILSTSHGVMTGHEARAAGVGGAGAAAGSWRRSGSAHVPHRQEAHPGPLLGHRHGRARGRARGRPAGHARGAQEPGDRRRPGGRRAARPSPDRPRRAPRPARAHPLARGEHGRG